MEAHEKWLEKTERTGLLIGWDDDLIRMPLDKNLPEISP